jgi:hypothetical protein
MQCRSITGAGGTASYCGFAEYGTPSVPPIYYLQQNLSGVANTQCGGPSCSPTTCSQSCTYGGVNTYDPNTCALTENGTVTIAGTCSTTSGPTPRLDVLSADPSNMVTGVGLAIQDQYPNGYTHNLISPSPGNCVLSGSGFTGCLEPGTNCGTATLSNPDTAQNAINRAIAGQSYGAAGDCSLAYTFATFPNAGSRVFAFSQAEVQVSFAGVPGGSYQVVVTLMDRAVGTSGPLVPYGQIEMTVTMPPSGNAVTPWTAIPLDQGYEIHATACTVTPQ